MILIVTAEFNEIVTSKLKVSAENFFNENNVKFNSVSVPGAVEIPIAIQHFCKIDLTKYSAVIALGCVIKGDTDHYDMVLKSVTENLNRLTLDLSIPILHGVLACHDFEQAWKRRFMGKEYAATAIYMSDLLREKKS